MTTLEEKLKQIEVQFNLIQLSSNEVTKLISKKKLRDLEKCFEKFQDRYDKIRELKDEIQEKQLEAEKPVEEVQTWGEEFDERIEQTEGPMNELKAAIEAIKEESEERFRGEEEIKERNRSKKRQDEELKLEEMKLKMRAESEKKLQSEISATTTREREVKVKLPKLQITKLQGSRLDWLRFWSQYEYEIDKTELDPVTKFSYLKELIVPKVRQMIDGLPFTTEGYTCAKTILNTKFGKPSEVANAHIQSIMALQPVHNSNPKAIHEFYEKLSLSVQSLETMGKLKEINGYVRQTIDKLPGIRAVLIRLDDGWQDWKFPKLLNSLRTWTERNPLNESHSNHNSNRNGIQRDRLMQTRRTEARRICAYCNSNEHNSINCSKVTRIEDRRRILKDKKLCFNCTGSAHKAEDCASKRSCMNCHRRHHTSVCDKRTVKKEPPLCTTKEAKVIYPVVIVNVEGQRCRALLDTGAGNSYASSTLLNSRKVTSCCEDSPKFSHEDFTWGSQPNNDEHSRNFLDTKIKKLTKSVINRCNSCKRYHAVAFTKPPPGLLPTSRTTGNRAFQVFGTDYAGPILYRKGQKKDCKSYILLFSCSLSRAVYIELVPDLTTGEFIRCLKRSLREEDQREYFLTMQKPSKLQRNGNNIVWQINNSKAPWWGGQFERLIALTKQVLYRINWYELEEVLLDVKQSLNNRPLSYVEDDVQKPILTRNSYIFGKENHIPEKIDVEEIEETELRKPYKYFKRCKESIRKRWSMEYLTALRERHNLKHNTKVSTLSVGEVVLIKGESKNRGTWKIGVVNQVFPGPDGILRSVQVKSGKSMLERPIQLLYPLELKCDRTTSFDANKATPQLDVAAKEFRPKRNAAAIARLKINLDDEDDDEYDI